jgi:hypothetical protein
MAEETTKATSTMTWDHQAHKDLLGVISMQINPTAEVIRGFTAGMHRLGYTPTAKAITY